ncbi:unnamed protein product [Mucor hiemalis]
MLEDDELDFDDFGELTEFEGQEMTTEELEKQLAMEFPDLPLDLEPVEPAVVEKPVISQPTTEEKKVVKEELDEGEIVEETEPTTTTTATTESEKKFAALDKPLEAASRPRYNNNNHFNNNNNNRYNQQYMMPMNNFPYPQFSNRIYVNPNFQGGQQQQQQQQQMLAQQQFAQQQRYMELEQQRLALLQQQKQSQQMNDTDLDQKRREAAEMMKRRRENNQQDTKQQVGDKRKYESNHKEDRDVKRPEIVFRQSPAGGISIKGAAAAAREIRTYTPPHQRNGSNIRDRIGSNSPVQRGSEGRPSIIDRLSSNNNNLVQPQHNVKPQQQQQQQQQQQPYHVPIVTGGKSNTLLLKGFTGQVNDQDLKKMTAGSTVKNTTIDQNDKSATLVFATVEDAVTFRRKYNR